MPIAYDTLTGRELRSLDQASHGVTERESAILFHVSVEAAKDYRRQVRRKMRARNMTHAVALALRRGLIV